MHDSHKPQFHGLKQVLARLWSSNEHIAYLMWTRLVSSNEHTDIVILDKYMILRCIFLFNKSSIRQSHHEMSICN